MIKRFLPVLVAVTTICGAVPARAGYSGSDVTFQYYLNGGAYDFAGSNSPSTFAAPGSVDFLDDVEISVSDTQITFDYITATNWAASTPSITIGGLAVGSGPVITSDALSIPAITGISIDPASVLPGTFTSADIGWDATDVAVTWEGQDFALGDELILDVSFAVPEPASLTLLAGGVLGLGLLRRRRRG